ncbi:6-hydroxynicotinate 3-monooxygenase [Cyphellophora attinorum]|uniref:6-hydroxynicotinate 3-monooxygenase n=1 Tax=Cyphellophora attinorum TaxID=1664694 RepID=A0A0N0NM99_9EURO|nr:6-hydroxynicotinate 3-monooxygenase [Phialophora attinorum]KPI40211.1 6-hydroxynicotinate 3-monooxygenase [Phialophora attinorum]
MASTPLHSSGLPPPHRIAIVGAGLAGLSLTLLLSRVRSQQQPLHITILELRPRHAQDGGFLALAPNALHILDQLGLYQKLLPQGFAYEDIAFYSARNLSRIGRVKNGDVKRYGYPALRIGRGIVRGELLRAVEELATQDREEITVEMRFETKVVSVSEKEKNVILGLASGEELTFDAVIGADGIHSRVRNLVNGDVKPTFSGMLGIGGGRLDRRDIRPQDLSLPAMFMGKSNAFMMMPTSADGNEVTFFATMEVEERDREGWAKLGEDKQELKRIMVDRHCGRASEWPAVVVEACRSGKADSLSIWPHYNAPILESWTSSSNRIILMGDAAHAMPPTGGQGAAMAFEDAASLAMVFERSDTAEAFDKGVDEWQTTRQDRARKIKEFTTKSGDMRRTSPSVFQQIVKEWIMWLYFKVKGSDGGLAWVYEHKEKCPGDVKVKV